jgi:flavodoxin
MNTLVIYFSKFGNTQAIAETIAKRIASKTPVRIISYQDLTAESFKETELVIMGSPTHNMNLPKALRPFFSQLPKKLLKGKYFTTFDTSYKMSWWLNKFTAGKKLTQKLRKMGGKKLLPPEIFLVTERQGPLYPGEIEHAQDWAARVLEQAGRLKPDEAPKE